MKISLYGHFGSLNSGNEGTLLAILSRLRSVYPDGDFSCICTHPDVVAARDGIKAVPIASRTARIWDRELRLDRRVRTAFTGLSEEIRQYGRAFRELRAADMLIVPGTGLLTDAYGLSSWGPYNLFKWSLLARLRGCRVLYISVGAGPIYSVLGRFLVKLSLSLSSYRSYRDDSSMKYLETIGFHKGEDRVYPDLVFSLPKALLPAANRNRSSGRRVVGLGLMLYAGRYSAADPRERTYTGYLESLVSFTDWLLAHDYDVRLLLGDEDDTGVIEEFKSCLHARLGAFDGGRLIDEPITSVEEVLAQIAATDIVVATRFHNTLLPLLLNKPVIAVSFHHKCASLMREMGLSHYCTNIEDIDTDKLLDQFQDLERNYDDLKQLIERKVDEARKALDEQYDSIFETS